MRSLINHEVIIINKYKANTSSELTRQKLQDIKTTEDIL